MMNHKAVQVTALVPLVLALLLTVWGAIQPMPDRLGWIGAGVGLGGLGLGVLSIGLGLEARTLAKSSDLMMQSIANLNFAEKGAMISRYCDAFLDSPATGQRQFEPFRWDVQAVHEVRMWANSKRRKSLADTIDEAVNRLRANRAQVSLEHGYSEDDLLELSRMSGEIRVANPGLRT